MRQPIVWISVLIVMSLMLIIILTFVNMQKTPPKTFPADNGPGFIDVSSYPPQMQETYKVFGQKCSRCHTLARPINSKFVGEEWRKYVYKMMGKPGSGLTPKIADKIIPFLIYDAQVRKR